MVVPPGSVWPLPVYELALMTAGEARGMGQDDVVVTVVTPEHAPLSLFGEEASAAVAEELRGRASSSRPAWSARVEPGGLALEPGGEQLAVQRVFAVPRVLGPGLEGLPADDEGFILADDSAGSRAASARGPRATGSFAGQVRRARDAPGAPRGRGDRAARGRRGCAGPR